MSIHLPLPEVDTQQGLASLLFSRLSTKRFSPTQTLTTQEVSKLLWAAVGLTSEQHRVAPSARTTYPVSVTLITGAVRDLEHGAYHL